MLGYFEGVEDEGRYYTVFKTWDKGIIVRICQHDNMSDAESMANELNVNLNVE